MALGAVVALPSVARAETVTYSYDARGRLITVAHNGGPNASVSVQYGYDFADNRTQRTVTGSSQRRMVVVPLNGFTVIPID